jgi:hypothetical protein
MRYHLFNSVLIKVDIILSKSWSLLQVFVSLIYNSSKLDFVDSVQSYYFGNLLSLNFWLFINLFYLVGHWGNWSIRLYHNLFAITGQFDMFSFLLHFPLHGQFDFLFIPIFPIRSIRPEQSFDILSHYLTHSFFNLIYEKVLINNWL